MEVMVVVILVGFFTVVGVIYLGSKEDVHEGAHRSVEESTATTQWLARADAVESALQAKMEKQQIDAPAEA